MNRLFFPCLAVASIMAAGPIAALGEDPKMTKDGITSETKVIKGNEVTVFVNTHDGQTMVEVKIAIGRIHYSEINVIGLNQDGKQVKSWNGPENEKNTLYADFHSASERAYSRGLYRLFLGNGERLEKVKITRGDESYTFNVAWPVAAQPKVTE